MEYSSRLMVLPVRGVYWSHWGSEQRIMKVVQNTGELSGRRHWRGENADEPAGRSCPWLSVKIAEAQIEKSR